MRTTNKPTTQSKQAQARIALEEKIKNIEFQARAQFGTVFSQLEELLEDEKLINSVHGATLDLLTNHSDNLSGNDLTGFFRLFSFLTSIQHLQYLQAKSGKKQLIY